MEMQALFTQRNEKQRPLRERLWSGCVGMPALPPYQITMSLILCVALFLGLLWLTQTLVRRGMDDGSGGAED